MVLAGEEEDDEASASTMLLPIDVFTTALYDGNRSDSDSSLSSFTNLNSACTDIVEELKISEIRWFFKYDAEKKWTSFLGCDSLRLESRFRELKKMDDVNKEQDKCQMINETPPSEETKDENCLIHVRGGLYKADVKKRKCESIYWAGEQFPIMRGMWFHDGTWQPLDESSSEQIESAHLKKFFGQKCSDFIQVTPSKGPKPVIHNLQLPNFHVDWNSPREVFLFSEATSSKLMRSFTQRFGFQKSGYRLHRGYSEEATPLDKPTDITHLVFVIHGIGQKGEVSKIIRNCSKLRDCASYLKKKYFTLLQDSSERSEFFPVEWRSNLKLDGDTVESVTPHKIRGLRELLNRTAMDIMYYTSPLYRTEIVNCLTHELNRLYTMFCQWNPSFEAAGGKVSVVAHSLGCVIMYDILTGFNPVQLYLKDLVSEKKSSAHEEKCSTIQDELEETRRRVVELEAAVLEQATVPKISLLKFKIENFFCLGSPLAVFLALRGIRPNDATLDDVFPSWLVKRLFNIYHPSDPVAYRLEPLIVKHYVSVMPLQIYYYAAIDKLPYESMSCEPLVPSRDEKEKYQSKESVDDATRSPEKVTKVAESRWSLMWSGWRKQRGSPTLEQELTAVMISEAKEKLAQSAESPSNGSPVDSCPDKPEVTVVSELDYRLDYMLREGNLDSSGYLAAFTAHTCYWSSYDVVYFLLTYLHPDMDPTTSVTHAACSTDT